MQCHVLLGILIFSCDLAGQQQMQFTVLLPQDVQMTFMIFRKGSGEKHGAEFLDAVTRTVSLCTTAMEAGVLLITV
jgi:hypothetical protein